MVRYRYRISYVYIQYDDNMSSYQHEVVMFENRPVQRTSKGVKYIILLQYDNNI